MIALPKVGDELRWSIPSHLAGSEWVPARGGFVEAIEIHPPALVRTRDESGRIELFNIDWLEPVSIIDRLARLHRTKRTVQKSSARSGERT